MKIKNVMFLARVNINGNKKSSVILVLMILLVVSLTLIPSFSITINNAINEFKEDYRARSLVVHPWNQELSDEVLERIMQVDHVENIYMLQGMRNQLFDILDISDENGTYEELQQQITERNGYVDAWSLMGSEKRSVIAGKSLDETPTFSCIIPSLFYPFDDTGGTNNNLDYIDGESLIGKTLTITANSGQYYEVLYNYTKDGLGGNEWAYLPALEYKLKIVGVYYSSPTAIGYYDCIYVSEETGRLIQKMAIEASSYDLTSNTSDIAKWWNTPGLRTHYLLVDDYDNITDVYNNLTDMKVECSGYPELGIKESVLIISNILSVAGTFFILATLLLCIINLIQSTSDSLKNRKGEIGLLKAIGYKNRQIFFTIYYEQIYLTLKGFFIGGGFSAIFIAVANVINKHGTYVGRLYIVSWQDFFIFWAISLATVIIVPTICQIITLHKLNKIQPKDAMNEN